jgi:hypothetical protein
MRILVIGPCGENMSDNSWMLTPNGIFLTKIMFFARGVPGARAVTTSPSSAKNCFVSLIRCVSARASLTAGLMPSSSSSAAFVVPSDLAMDVATASG